MAKDLKKLYKTFVKDGIIFLELLGQATTPLENEELVKLMRQDFEKLIEKESAKKVNVVFDTMVVHNPAWINLEAGKQYVAMSNHPKVNKIATCGSDPIMKGFAKFVISSSGKKDDIQWFDSVEEGVNWLNQ